MSGPVTSVTLADVCRAAVAGGLEEAAVMAWASGTPSQQFDRLRDEFAMAALNARTSAAWTHPTPSNVAYEKWRNSLPPGTEDGGFMTWLARMAYEQADAMLKARVR